MGRPRNSGASWTGSCPNRRPFPRRRGSTLRESHEPAPAEADISFLSAWRRRRLLARPAPPHWRRIIQENVLLFRALSPARQRRLEDLARVLLDEKDFEGCGGLAMTDPIRVTIAGQAALLLLGRDMDYLPELRAVLVYPTGYWARSVSQPIPGVVSERDEGRLGESSPGTVVLSWDDSRTGARRAEGENVVLHEFAHQVDRHFGLTESLTERPVSDLSPWQRSFRREFERFTGAERPREGRLLDEYAATNPAEFLAVGTEVFMERPGPLRDACPRLYGLFRALYRIDPGREFDIP